MLELVYVAGEASGDRHAAALHRTLLETRPAATEVSARGIGGSAMRAAGIELLMDSSRWGAIGVIESLRGVPMYYTALQRIKADLMRRPPAALILVDFGYFNVKLARWAKKHAIAPLIYYMPPGSWKRKATVKRSRELAGLCDLIITPFRWSDENLRAAGANSHWVGHPLVDIVRPTLETAQFDSDFGVDPRRPIVALLPGSRTAEVEHILPMMLSAARIISKRVPGTQFLLAAAPNMRRDVLESMLRQEQDRAAAAGSKLTIIKRAGGKLKQIAASAMDAATPAQPLVTSEGFLVKPTPSHDEADARGKPWHQVDPKHAPVTTLAIVENLTYDCLARADLVITASGTATLEAAILGRPMIIVYRGSKLMEMEYHLRKRMLAIDHIGLPNILAGRRIVPELLQEQASPIAVADLAVGMLIEPERLFEARRAMNEKIRPELGEPGAIQRAAALIWRQIAAGSDRERQ